jgi:CRP/FNR family transcriptional regulator
MNITEQFRDYFEPGLIEALEQKSVFHSAAAGDTLMEIGQTIRLIPILLSGSLKVSRTDEEGRELLLYYINPGESCAMTFTCCMQQYPSEVKAVAEEDSELLLVPITLMDEWMATFNTWKSYVMKTIRGRFIELLKTIDQIAFQKLDERLVHYLKEKSRATASTLLHISHEHIAQELATSRVVISRLLKKLENEKKLLLYRNQIKLLREL